MHCLATHPLPLPVEYSESNSHICFVGQTREQLEAQKKLSEDSTAAFMKIQEVIKNAQDDYEEAQQAADE